MSTKHSTNKANADIEAEEAEGVITEKTTHKKGRGLSLLLAAVPILLALFFGLIAYFAGLFLSIFNEKIGTGTPIKTLNASDEGWVYLVQYLLYVIFFGLWYWHLIQKREKEMFLRQKSGMYTPSRLSARAKKEAASWNPVTYWAARLPLLVVLGYSLQLGCSAIIAIFSTAFPDVFSAYKELIQSMSGAGVDIKTVIAVCFLAPIGEELMFRGVSYHYSRCALSAGWAIVFQAVLFGIYHGNVIQFVYATGIGILLGYLRRQSGSVVPGIVLHMIINMSSYVIPALWIETVPKASVIMVVSILVIIPCCIILLKQPKKKKAKAAADSSKKTSSK